MADPDAIEKRLESSNVLPRSELVALTRRLIQEARRDVARLLLLERQVATAREVIERWLAQPTANNRLEHDDPWDGNPDEVCAQCGATPGDGLTEVWWCMYCKKLVEEE